MKPDLISAANQEPFTVIQGPRTGKDFQVRRHTYGVLVPDAAHPLSAVSVANSSLSIDLWAGCAWQCSYCHVQDTAQDLVDGARMPKRPVRRTNFSIQEILDELVEHPFFCKDQTIISIGTASTEPFALGPVADSTFEIMHALVGRGLKNPLWIVTKGGVPKGRKQDFAAVVKAVKGLMISLCWADNPDTIEPMRNNRFLHSEDAKEAGATISWYMRPIVPEWSGSLERIEMMMLWVKSRYSQVIDMIIPGGLRWTQGIEYGLTELRSLPMPNIPHQDNIKDLPESIWQHIMELGSVHFPGVPIYRHSSCALSRMLRIPNLAGIQVVAKDDCEASRCPACQRETCTDSPLYGHNVQSLQQVLDGLGIPARAIGFDSVAGPITEPDLKSFTYAIRRTVLKKLAEGG
jgi:DNA repair photolyase